MNRGEAVPEWKVDRVTLIKRMFDDPDALARLAPFAKYYEDIIVPLGLSKVLLDYGVPIDCDLAVLYRLNSPNATDVQVAAHIPSPVEYVSHYHKRRGPAPDEQEAYRIQRNRTLKLISLYGDDRLDDDTNVYIQIEPFTTKNEVISFIKSQWNHIEGLLAKSVVDSTGQLDSRPLRARKKKLIYRGHREQAEAVMVQLKKQGLNASQIADAIKERFGLDYEPSNIRTILSRRKKT